MTARTTGPAIEKALVVVAAAFALGLAAAKAIAWRDGAHPGR